MPLVWTLRCCRVRGLRLVLDEAHNGASMQVIAGDREQSDIVILRRRTFRPPRVLHRDSDGRINVLLLLTCYNSEGYPQSYLILILSIVHSP